MSDPVPGATSDEEVLQAIQDHRAPAVGTGDVADAVGVSRQAADYRLKNLKDDGLIDTELIGQTKIWWLTNAGERYLEK